MSFRDFLFKSESKPVIYTKDKRQTTNLSLGFIKLHWLFDIENLTTKVFIVCLVAMFVGTYNFFLLERTGLYSLGINSIFQSIARCVSYFLKKGSNDISAKTLHIILFWGMNLVMNIPLAVMGFKKIGKRFTFLTIIYICVSSLTSMSLASLPPSLGLKNFHIFSDPRTFNKELIDKNIQILQWNYITNFNVGEAPNRVSFAMNDSSRVVLIFIYGIVFGLLNTVSSIFVYSLGGSSGGIDWIIFYYIKKKRKRLNNLYFYLSVLLTFVAYVVGTYVPYVDFMLSKPSQANNQASSIEISGNAAINNTQHSVISSLLGPMFIATVVAALTKRIMYHFFYPSFKIINVKIYTQHPVELRRKLLQSNFPQSFTINLAIGGFKLRNQTVFEVACFALDLKMLKDLAKSIDPTCLIVSVPVKSLTGRVVVQDNIN